MGNMERRCAKENYCEIGAKESEAQFALEILLVQLDWLKRFYETKQNS